MGRELRNVPPNWQHPTDDRAHFIPLYDGDYDQKLAAWFKDHQAWERGDHPELLSGSESKDKYPRYANWAGDPPKADNHHPRWAVGSDTWCQVYETVTEGTPVTPPFATHAELINYLVTQGELPQESVRGVWEPGRRWSRAAAEQFVQGDGYAPSFVIVAGQIIPGAEYIKDRT